MVWLKNIHPDGQHRIPLTRQHISKIAKNKGERFGLQLKLGKTRLMVVTVENASGGVHRHTAKMANAFSLVSISSVIC